MNQFGRDTLRAAGLMGVRDRRADAGDGYRAMSGWTPPGTPYPMPRVSDFVAFAGMLAGGCTVLALLVVGVDAVTRWWR